MSDTPPPVTPATDEALAKKRRKKRIYGFIAIALFVGFGVFYFGGRVPREVHLRFDLPPLSRSGGIAIARARVSQVTATIATPAGAQLASVNVPLPNGLDTPRTPTVVINLPAGHYLVHAHVHSFEGADAQLEGGFDAAEGEVVVDLH